MVSCRKEKHNWKGHRDRGNAKRSPEPNEFDTARCSEHSYLVDQSGWICYVVVVLNLHSE